jgi:hypothetical protein
MDLGGFFATMLMGHMVGDYLLQGRHLAMNKAGSTPKCLIHCMIYTVSVCLFTWPFIHGYAWSAIVFLSHFPIDRWGLAYKWLDMINGRSLGHFMIHGEDDIPTGVDRNNYHAIRAGFTSLVYAAADNTMHIVIMWYGAMLLS